MSPSPPPLLVVRWGHTAANQANDLIAQARYDYIVLDAITGINALLATFTNRRDILGLGIDAEFPPGETRSADGGWWISVPTPEFVAFAGVPTTFAAWCRITPGSQTACVWRFVVRPPDAPI